MSKFACCVAIFGLLSFPAQGQDTNPTTSVGGVPFVKPFTRPSGITDDQWSQLQLYTPKNKVAAPKTLTLDPMTSPVPFVSFPLVPSSVPPGSGDFVLTVNGSQFVQTSTINWNGTALATAFVSATKLTALVPASKVATTGTALVTVSSQAPGGGVSDPISLTVRNTSRFVTFGNSAIDVGVSPSSIVVADFNNDGVADLAVVNQNDADPICSNLGTVGTISILLGNGDGTFSSKSKLCSPFRTNALYTTTTGDFNSDGNQDLIVSLETQGLSMEFEAFLGNGDGTFTYLSNSGGWDGIGPVITGDFDQNGQLDIAVPVDLLGHGLIQIWLGEGNGEFAYKSSANAYYTPPRSIATDDFNRDGILDLASGYVGPPSTIFLGNGDGTFTPTSSQPSTPGVLIGDFDGDGIPDLVGLGRFMKGNGDGTFTDVGPGPDLTSGYQFRGPVPGAMADLNGDNKPDVVAAGPTNNIMLYLGNGDGTFQTPISITVGQSPHSVAVGDFNRDGLLDLAVANSGDNTVTILLQNPGCAASVQPPINSNGSSVFKANRGAIPVKFTLTQNDTATCQLPPATISVTRTAGQALGSVAEDVYSMPSDNGSNFRIDSYQYVYNLAASALGVGTYQVDISINGIVVGHAVFALK